MSSGEIFDEFHNLIVNCVENKCSPKQYFTFYNEFFNEKFGNALKTDTEAQKTNATNELIGGIEAQALPELSADSETPPIDEEQKKRIYSILSDCFIKNLRSPIVKPERFITVVDYLIQVCFMDYNSSFVQNITEKIYQLSPDNEEAIIYFFTKSTHYFNTVTDQLIINDFLINDIPKSILPNLLVSVPFLKSKQLIVSLGKFLYSILSKYDIGAKKMQISNNGLRDGFSLFFERLDPISRLLSRNLKTLVESKVEFVDSSVTDSKKLEASSNLNKKLESSVSPPAVSLPVETPSITSPLPSTLPPITNTTTQPSNPQSSTNQKFYDIKLVRYYKNMWLNNKIHNWTTDEIDFLPKYQGIDMTINPQNSIPSLDIAIVDFINTSFTCFAQFLNNKVYHQAANSNFTLLEKKWYIFITKRIPLIIEKYCGPNKSYLAIKALKDLDDKIVKVFRSYYTNNQTDSKNSENDDLFDNFNSPSQPEMDIRHDFLKNLCMMKLQQPAVINEFSVTDDDMIDVSSLLDNDLVMVLNKQNNLETIHDLKGYIKDSLNDFDFESLFVHDNVISDKNDYNGILYLFKNFENIAPTSQLVIAETLVELTEASVQQFNYKLLSKICALLTLNLGNSLPAIFTLTRPTNFILPLVKFIDEVWDENKDQVFSTDGDNSLDSDVECFNDYIYFNFVLIFLIYIQDQYHVDIVSIITKTSGMKNLEKSFLLQYLNQYMFPVKHYQLPITKEPYKAAKLLQDWSNNLLVDNSISDELIKNSNIKDLAYLIPFIFEQTMMVFQNLISSYKTQTPNNFSNLEILKNFNGSAVASFEYFSQPFLMIGLVKIVFNLNSMLKTFKDCGVLENEHLLSTFLNLLTPLFNESGLLSAESKVLQHILYSITGPRLLFTLRTFRKTNSHGETVNNEAASKLEFLISKLEKICEGSNIYDLNPELFTSDTGESLEMSPRSGNQNNRTQVFFDFKVTIDATINRIMNNQSKSFWNLHSSTFYNYDYLQKVVSIISPGDFFIDIHKTLTSKVKRHGIPTIGNAFKKSDDIQGDIDVTMEYLVYFIILLDFSDDNEKQQVLQFLESPMDLQTLNTPSQDKELTMENENTEIKQENLNEEKATDQNVTKDDDFNMLFGEDSVENIDDVLMDDAPKAAEKEPVATTPAEKLARMSFLGKSTFAIVLYNYSKTQTSPFEGFESFYEKYLNLLKRSII